MGYWTTEVCSTGVIMNLVCILYDLLIFGMYGHSLLLWVDDIWYVFVCILYYDLLIFWMYTLVYRVCLYIILWLDNIWRYLECMRWYSAFVWILNDLLILGMYVLVFCVCLYIILYELMIFWKIWNVHVGISRLFVYCIMTWWYFECMYIHVCLYIILYNIIWLADIWNVCIGMYLFVDFELQCNYK